MMSRASCGWSTISSHRAAVPALPRAAHRRLLLSHQSWEWRTHVYTDEYDSYNHLERPHATVAHGQPDWACDADGDGICEVHTNTCDRMWAGLRTFLRPSRGVHKRLLSGYVAIHEFRVNLKRISGTFIAALVGLHSLYR